MDLVVENSRSLYEMLDGSDISRLSAFETRYPPTIHPSKTKLVHLECHKEVTNVFQDSCLPPEDIVRLWKLQLSSTIKTGVITDGFLPFIQCSFPSGDRIYDQNSLEEIQRIHRLQNSKVAIAQELDWFAEVNETPVSLQKYPPQNSLRTFQKLLYDTPYNQEVPGYGMYPGELAKLCCQRWLSSDHMHWFTEKINSSQKSSVCVYINHVSNVERTIERLMSSRSDKPTRVIFLVNVGRDEDDTYIGNDINPGVHWTICILHRDTKAVVYGDSLGWKMPYDLLDKIQPYVTSLWSDKLTEYSTRYCHDPSGTSGVEHICQATCSCFYPLQKDSSICGVVVLLMAGLAFADNPSFNYLLSNDESGAEPASASLMHLTDPTLFSGYLRRVLITWFAEKTIDICYLLPAGPQFANDEEKDARKWNLPIKMAGSGGKEKGKVTNLLCMDCGEKFSRNYNLKRHIQRHHPDSDVASLAALDSGICQCQLCSFKCYFVNGLRQHLCEEHGLIFRTESIAFNSYSEFEQWKTQLEESEDCSFVKSTGDKESHGVKIKYFHCNRSGAIRSATDETTNRKRRDKSQGSSKIATKCTSTMTVKVDHEGQVNVDVCYTHHGHSKSLEHLRLPKCQRAMIAAKIQQGVTRERILDDIRESVGETFRRQHLIERQDLANLERAFGLHKVQRHGNDQQSVLAWISEWESANESENPVLYHKFQGEEDKNGYDLTTDDFFLVVQTTFQRDMLTKFAGNGICCDSTHGTNAYDFPLTTIHVVDEFGEGIPVAWCLSSHEDFTSMVIFFSEIKKNCGPVESAFFMSDMANQFFNAWVGVMEGKRPTKLLCTWHVDKAWKEELRKKVGNVSLEGEIYKMLRTCLEQTSETRFEDCLTGLLNRLAFDSNTMNFGKYFRKEWVGKKTQWAYCFRLRMGINTNMFAEAFHRVFKRVYLGGKVNKRVDCCLYNLVKFARDKAFERAIKLTKGKATYRISNIKAHHSQSLLIRDSSVEKVAEDRWVVVSESVHHKHEVLKVSANCVFEQECKMVCSDCKVCVHMFECSCPDSLIVGTICKHVHAVCRVASPPGAGLRHNRPTIPNELKSLTSHVKGSPRMETQKLRQIIQGKITWLQQQVDVATNLEALRALDKQLSAAASAFTAFTTCGNPPQTIRAQEENTPNKKMATQARFFSTKKKRSKTAGVRYARPSWKEREQFVAMLCSTTTTPQVADYEILSLIANQSAVASLIATGSLISSADLIKDDLSGELLQSTTNMQEIQKYLKQDAWEELQKSVEELRISWTCSKCKEAKFTQMIACDRCDKWYHWSCTGVKEEPQSWICNGCFIPKKTSSQ